MATRIEELTATLRNAHVEWFDLSHDDDPRGEPGPPATTSDTARLAAKFRHRLPPSYLEFMHNHNGWSHFSGDANLLSISDYEQEWYAYTEELFSLASYDEASPFADLIPIVVGRDTRLAVFLDPKSADERGEMEVVEFHDTEEKLRHADFAAFLESRIEAYEFLVNEQKNGDEYE